MKAKTWDATNPDTPITDESGKATATDAKNIDALAFLMERVHDDIAWVMTSDNPENNARKAFTNLKNEIGKLRQTTKSAIDKAKAVKLLKNDYNNFFAAVDEAQLGVKNTEFGKKHRENSYQWSPNSIIQSNQSSSSYGSYRLCLDRK
jgi:hypothetical protein